MQVKEYRCYLGEMLINLIGKTGPNLNYTVREQTVGQGTDVHHM